MSFEWLNPSDRAAFLEFMDERFGLGPDLFEGYALFRKGEFISAVTRPAVEAADELDGEDAGLQLARVTHSGNLKPVTRGMQAFGAGATKNVVDLDGGGVRALMEGRRVEAGGLRGFVLVRFKGALLGVGLVRDGMLESQFPRSMTEHLVLSDKADLV